MVSAGGAGRRNRKLGDQAKLARRRSGASPPLLTGLLGAQTTPRPSRVAGHWACCPQGPGGGRRGSYLGLSQALEGLHHRLFWPGGLRLQREEEETLRAHPSTGVGRAPLDGWGGWPGGEGVQCVMGTVLAGEGTALAGEGAACQCGASRRTAPAIYHEARLHGGHERQLAAIPHAELLQLPRTEPAEWGGRKRVRLHRDKAGARKRSPRGRAGLVR